jgi:hypothetical protein
MDFMTTIDEQAAFLTEVQQACRKARDSRRNIDLQKAAALMDSPRFTYLPEGVQEDLTFAYAEAVQKVTGAFA